MLTLMPSLALFTFGPLEMVLLFGVIVILFGAKKLPGLARGLGEGIRNFKGELKRPPRDGSDEEE
ncbi:MAG TPA: twin-arginine translocase TatA/TatE family subunit [Longimicrobiales bacterium]|nr:twin-arginine translocase TatA/TatE family subunit [Longimicrobiales bacterium]